MLNEKILNYAAAVLLAVASCSGGQGDESKAQAMLAEAQQCLSTNPQRAIALIDSLNKTFVKLTDVRRQAMHVRTLADSVLYGLALLSWRCDHCSLKLFVLV